MVFVVPRLNSAERTPNLTRGGERSWPSEVTGISGVSGLAGASPRMHSITEMDFTCSGWMGAGVLSFLGNVVKVLLCNIL